MHIIGENIQILAPRIKAAIADRDPTYVRELARKQVDHGANTLDLNIRPRQRDGIDSVARLGEEDRQQHEVREGRDDPHERNDSDQREDTERESQSLGHPRRFDPALADVRVTVLGPAPVRLEDPVEVEQRDEEKPDRLSGP